MTWMCSVENGTRVRYQWFQDNRPIHARSRYTLSPNSSTLVISPVRKEDIGEYSCVVENFISQKTSEPVALNMFCKYIYPINISMHAHGTHSHTYTRSAERTHTHTHTHTIYILAKQKSKAKQNVFSYFCPLSIVYALYCAAIPLANDTISPPFLNK